MPSEGPQVPQTWSKAASQLKGWEQDVERAQLHKEREGVYLMQTEDNHRPHLAGAGADPQAAAEERRSGPPPPLLSFCQRKGLCRTGACRGENSDNGAESRPSHVLQKQTIKSPPPPFSPTPTCSIPGPGPLGTCSEGSPPAGRVQPLFQAPRWVPKCGPPLRREGRRSEVAPKTDG